MNVLLIDADRVGLDFCLRCASHGHSVKWFRWSKNGCHDGEGFPDIEIVDRWQDHMKWAKDGLILTTINNKYLYELDDFRRFGYNNIVAPTVASSRLETNREEGMRVMEQAGFSIPPYKTFNTLQEARKYVLKEDRNFCFKPAGDCEDKAVTFASSNPAQLVEWLDAKIKTGWTPKSKVMLQDKIEFIGEIGVAGYMGPEGFLPDKYELSAEFKKLCAHNFGPSTGEMGTVTQYVKADPMVDILKALEPVLMALGHRGDLAIGGCIDESGNFQFFEFTARQGWPDAFIRTAMNKGDPCEWMRAMMMGRDTLKVSYDPHIGVVCAQRPFPYSDGSEDEVCGKPIYGIEDHWQDVHPIMMTMGKGWIMTGDVITTGNIYRTSGNYVMVVTGSGSTVSKAMKDVYATIADIKLSDMICRSDIGADLEAELPKFHKHGFWKDMEF